jgi:hypothetical protein
VTRGAPGPLRALAAWSVRIAIVLVSLSGRTAAAAEAEADDDVIEIVDEDGDGGGADKKSPKSPDDGDEEIVEIVEDDGKGTAKKKSEPKAAATPAAPTSTLMLRGFARATGLGGIETRPHAPENAPLEERVPYERAAMMQQVYAEVRYARGDSLRAVLSGSLAYSLRLTEGSALESGPARAIKSGQLEPVLREAYVGFFSSRADLRIGQQRVVWGNSDAITPNDILNARDMRTRTLMDPELVHLPTLAARANVELGRLTLGVVAQPFFVPDRTSLYGGSWAIIQPDAPRTQRRLFGLYARDTKDVNADDAPPGLVDSRAPTKLLEGASVGLSAKVNLGGADVSFYYHWGHDRTPFVYLDPVLAKRIDAAPPGAVNGTVIDALLEQRKEAQAAYGGPLLLQYVRRHHVGFDASTTLGPLVVRTDMAFDSASTFFSRATMNSIARPTAQGVLGLEYSASSEKAVLLEGWYMRMFDQEVPVVPTLAQANTGPVLFAEKDNVGVAAAVRWPLGGGFLIETRAFVGVTPRWYMVRPEIGWASSTFTIRAGGIIVDGEAGSTGGHYRRNDGAYLTARYTF